MRVLTLSRLSNRDVKAVRLALAAGAVAGLAVLGACADNGARTITSPTNPRNATIAGGGLTQAKTLTLCISSSSPSGSYTFVNSALNRRVPLDGFNNALSGNGFWDGTFWNDQGDGGDGTTSANANVSVPYSIAHTMGTATDCLLILNRTVGDAAFMAKLPIADGGTCTSSCGGVQDAFAAANISYQSNTASAVYNHTDCTLDNGVLMPQHVNPTTGSPPVPTIVWPTGGFDGSAPFITYGCGTSNVITRGFVNFEHGATLTYDFVPAPPQEVIPLFVIGDLVQWTLQPGAAPINGNKPVPPNTVNFWGSQWWKNNPMSLFHSNGWPSFKGYASSVNLTPTNGAPCGTWTSRVGNSPPPPQTIPEFVGIIVTNNVIKIGPDLGGGIQKIIIVHQDGGYGPNPGHDGNGPVTQIVCGGVS
jgi:hypothetical protein